MNQLEFNKPHIHQKLCNSWAIGTIQAINQRIHHDSMITPSWWRIDTVYPILQKMIDNPWDNESDIEQLNYIIYEVDTWIDNKGHHHPEIVKKVLKMIARATSALWCESLFTKLEYMQNETI